ncbi:MAG TPA: retron system putative HNH endonuclease [Chitinophagaceae bacterium]|nr:retron system putative HNH endonuclease [Chitinophagaceae bacterium]
MKHIVKGIEPKDFTDWKALENNDWRPMYDSLSGVEKKAVVDSLKAEQGYICCYCERSLDVTDYHIEHLKPKSLDDVDPLDYSNMMCSCQLRVKKGEPRHCGNSKDHWYKEDEFISPLNPDCEHKFIYTFDGYIEPASPEDKAATITIEKLQLKIDKLNALRRSAIEPFLDGQLTTEEIGRFVTGYLITKENNNGRFNEFFTTIKYLFP